jgi:hypothetical protein
MMAARARVGDVLELDAPRGCVYLQYLGKHPQYGDAVCVCRAPHAIRPAIVVDLFRDSYVAFYPAAAAVSRGLAKIVGRLPAESMPSRLRRPGARVGREVRTWIIEEPSGEIVKHALSAEELRLPIAAIWNHEMLLQRVEEGWRPESVGNHE